MSKNVVTEEEVDKLLGSETMIKKIPEHKSVRGFFIFS